MNRGIIFSIIAIIIRQKREFTIDSLDKGVENNTTKRIEKPIQGPNSDSSGISFSSIDQNHPQFYTGLP